MNLNTKATLLVGLLTFLAADKSSMKMVDDLLGNFVQMRDSSGALTREGNMMRSALYMLVTNMVMKAGRK